jgi:hypothetical protein
MSRPTPGLLIGVAASLWLVLIAIAILSIVVTFLLVAADGLFVILAVLSTAGLLSGDRHWERTVFMAWGRPSRWRTWSARSSGNTSYSVAEGADRWPIGA